MSSRELVSRVADALLRVDRDLGAEAMQAAALQCLLSIARIRIEAVRLGLPRPPVGDNVVSLERFRMTHRSFR